MFKGAVNQVRANARGMAKRDTYGAIVRPESVNLDNAQT